MSRAVRTALMVRHGESEYSVDLRLNGEVGANVGLTERGEEEARSLREQLAGEAIDLCVTSALRRTVQTAELALAGLDVPTIVVEDLGDPRYKGRTCLRTSQNEYNQSFVADRIAKDGLDATRALLESWMANDPQIINSDGEMLAVMAAGECDLGLANHYYLGRTLAENPAFPVAPGWPDQDGRGAHANVSGVGVVVGADAVPTAVALMEWLTSPPAQAEIVEHGEFAANPSVPPPPYVATWADVKVDPIDGEKAGPLIDDAVALMLKYGWT